MARFNRILPCNFTRARELAFSTLHATHIAMNRRQIGRRNYWTPSFTRFVPRSVACWPGNARFSFVQEIKGTRHHYVRVELVPDELESSLEYPLLLAVVEFHLRNNIPRISFVEIHSPLLEPVHYCESFATTDCFCVCGKRVTKCTVSLEWNGIFGIEDCAGSKFIVTTIFKFDNGVARMCGSLSSWKIYMLFSSRYL